MGSQIVKEKLHRAIGKDDKKTVKSILDNFPSLLDEQLTTDSRMTPLLKATKNRNIDMVLMLLEMGAIPDRANDNGITPLMMAAIRDDVQITGILLLQGNIEVGRQSNDGLAALDYAILYGHYQLAKILAEFRMAELKPAAFYYLFQKRHNSRFVNYPVLLMHLQKGLEDQALPDYLRPVSNLFFYTEPQTKDLVLDPNQSWRQFFKRIGDFQKPPLVQREKLPVELRPENRGILSKMRARIQLGYWETQQKISYLKENNYGCSGAPNQVTQIQINHFDIQQI